MAEGGLSSNFAKFATKKHAKEVVKGKPVMLLTSKDTLRWFKDSGCLGKACTSQSLDIAFSGVKGKEAGLHCEKVDTLIGKMCKDYAKDHKCTEEDAKTQISDKLKGAEKKTEGTTKTANKSTTDAMTDTSKYTGAHKERFGADGKGKGAEGREDRSENTGYVGNYKGEGTHDKKGKK